MIAKFAVRAKTINLKSLKIMKPEMLEMQIQRYRLDTAFNHEGAECFPGRLTSAGQPKPGQAAAGKTLLLVSEDAGMGMRLSDTASRAEFVFRQTGDSANAHRLAIQNHPIVVFLDLDLPAMSGWDAAERFLENERCPPLILLAGRSGQVDLETAIYAGAIMDKSASPVQLLEQISCALAEPDTARVNRHARQRLLVSWLRPYHWTVPVTQTVRHWGINE
jgi:CheY-like chemotaxis protein